MKHFFYLFLIMLILSSCQNPVNQNFNSTGSMVVFIGSNNIISSRTILPTDYESVIKEYEISLTGSKSITPIKITEQNHTIRNLVIGDYTLTVIGKDITGLTVAKGSKDIKIENGETTSISIELSQTQDSQGEIDLTLDWSLTGLENNKIDTIEASLIKVGESPKAFNITPEAMSLKYKDKIHSGLYTLIIHLKSGSQLYATVVEAAHIYDGLISEETINFNENSFTKPPVISSNLTLEQKGLTVELNWTDNSYTETGYKILRSEDGSTFSEIANNLDANLETYTDSTIVENKSYTYKVIATNVFGDSIPLEGSITTVDVTAPIPGNNGIITVSNVTSNGFSIDWTAASDNLTTTANLKYLLYYSTTNNINSVSDIENNGTAAGSLEKNITTKALTNLTIGETYYLNILVVDDAGIKNIYTPKAVNTLSGNLSIKITINTPTDASITISQANMVAVKQNEELTINLSETFDSYKWYVDGVIRSNISTITIDPDSLGLAPGNHNLTIVVKKDGALYSDSITFLVKQ